MVVGASSRDGGQSALIVSPNYVMRRRAFLIIDSRMKRKQGHHVLRFVTSLIKASLLRDAESWYACMLWKEENGCDASAA